jgi:hypothetical protein
MICAFLSSIRCHEETNDVGADAPCVIVAARHLSIVGIVRSAGMASQLAL